MGIKKESAKLVKERQELKKSKKKATKAMIAMIIALFRASNKERPVWKIRLEKSYSPGKFDCSVAFSNKDNKFYQLSCADLTRHATSEKLLRCGKDTLKDSPKTIDRMVYFKNTGFPKDILDRVYEKMHGLPEYQVRKIDGGIEITLNVPDYEK